jgi:hypothetical protein
MLIRGTLGTGYYSQGLVADILMDRRAIAIGDSIELTIDENYTTSVMHYQGRVDFDWDLENGFLFSAGVHEMFSSWLTSEHYDFKVSKGPSYDGGFFDSLEDNLPEPFNLDIENVGLFSAAYIAGEYQVPNSKLSAEASLRLDHFYFLVSGHTLDIMPAVSPRFNVDYNLIKNAGLIDELTITAGSGLFSTIPASVLVFQYDTDKLDSDVKPVRSWTSIVGAKADFSFGISINFEAYYKYIFDRAYTRARPVNAGSADKIHTYYFDGEGSIAGFDVLIQKLHSRYLDGWLSYSFNYALHKNPHGSSGRDSWFYPEFHRFHNINLVLNIKPVPEFNIALRVGFASGTPKSDDNDKRDGFSWPVDLKFSFFKFNAAKKVHSEIYVAAENLQSIVYDIHLATRGENYTGSEDMSEYTPVYDMPIPMLSFGFKWSF